MLKNRNYPFVNVCIDSVVVHGEDVGVGVVAGHTRLVNFEIRLSVKTFRKDGHDKDVDEEGDEESDGGLDEVVLVSLANGRRLSSIDVARFDEGRVKVEVVRHDHGTDDTHGLGDLAAAASRAPGDQHPFDYLTLCNECISY